MSGVGRVPGLPTSAGAGVPVQCVQSSVSAKCLVSIVPVCDRSLVFIAVDQTERKRGVWFREGAGVLLYKIYL